MSDKNLSGEEKRKLLKEQFKNDLKQRKEFLKKVKGLRRLNNINKALSDMNVEDDTMDWVDKLNQESAFAEAKVDIALESAKQVETEAVKEKEIQEFVAEELIKQMKREIALETGQPLPEDLKKEEPLVSEEDREAEVEEDGRPFRGMLSDLKATVEEVGESLGAAAEEAKEVGESLLADSKATLEKVETKVEGAIEEVKNSNPLASDEDADGDATHPEEDTSGSEEKG